jgi:glycosyltransferase involved in cell wall biosynthesis
VRFQPILTPEHAAAFEQLSRAWPAPGPLVEQPASDQALDQARESGLPDLLYQRLSPFGTAGSAFARSHGLLHVLEVNAPLAWEGKHYRRQFFSEAAEVLEADTLRTASLVVTVSHELRDALAQTGVPADKLVAVPNGVDTALLPTGRCGTQGLDGKIVVGFVGVSNWYGIGVLADAFRLLSLDSRYHLLVWGSGPEDRGGSGDVRTPSRPRDVARLDAARGGPANARAMDVAVLTRSSSASISPLRCSVHGHAAPSWPVPSANHLE